MRTISRRIAVKSLFYETDKHLPWTLCIDEKKRAEDERKREEESWQKIKPTAKEWKKWQSSLDQIGRFQCVQGYSDMPFKYIIDTKEGHVWILEAFSQISYIGRVFPLKEMNEPIRELP